jgi:signal transduction histidine kinase/sugar lactone lactonase YvrE
LFRFPQVSRIEQLAHTPPKAVYHALGNIALDEVFRLYEDARGDIWISGATGTRRWISRWKRATNTFHNYTEADGLRLVGDYNVLPLTTAFREDRAGNLWVGSDGHGLARFRNGQFTVFTTSDGVPDGWVRDLYLDHAGRLWIASSRDGVSRIDDPTAEHPRFINYKTDNGLASDSVWCITEDEGHRIYVGTSRGLDRLDPESGHIRHYTQADGLAENEVQVAFRDAHGSLWFGTTQGLSRFDPQPDESPASPPILIRGLRVNGIAQHISELGETEISKLVLAPNENQVQIDFVGLDFGTRKELRYQYKLEGADSTWSEPSDQRTVNFANLAPRSYKFFVRAVNSDGVVSSTPAVVTLTILPPLWARWWFLTVAVIVIGMMVHALYRYRVARILEVANMRTRIATDLHDDIGANLTKIAILSEVAKQQQGNGDASEDSPLSSIAEIARESVGSMSDIVWAINPKRDHLIDLVRRMRREAEDLFTARDIKLRFHAPGEEQDLRLGVDVRRDLFLIFKEAINNAARHSHCRQVTIEFRVDAPWLTLEVADDGAGFDLSNESDGHGLENMRQRAAALGGEITIHTGLKQGTSIGLKVPYARSRRMFGKKSVDHPV